MWTKSHCGCSGREKCHDNVKNQTLVTQSKSMITELTELAYQLILTLSYP